jgi:hypothetical protein
MGKVKVWKKREEGKFGTADRNTYHRSCLDKGIGNFEFIAI